jgi:hypothetical protein
MVGNPSVSAIRQLLLEQRLGKGQSRLERSVPICRPVCWNSERAPMPGYRDPTAFFGANLEAARITSGLPVIQEKSKFRLRCPLRPKRTCQGATSTKVVNLVE